MVRIPLCSVRVQNCHKFERMDLEECVQVSRRVVSVCYTLLQDIISYQIYTRDSFHYFSHVDHCPMHVCGKFGITLSTLASTFVFSQTFVFRIWVNWSQWQRHLSLWLHHLLNWSLTKLPNLVIASMSRILLHSQPRLEFAHENSAVIVSQRFVYFWIVVGTSCPIIDV